MIPRYKVSGVWLSKLPSSRSNVQNRQLSKDVSLELLNLCQRKLGNNLPHGRQSRQCHDLGGKGSKGHDGLRVGGGSGSEVCCCRFQRILHLSRDWPWGSTTTPPSGGASNERHFCVHPDRRHSLNPNFHNFPPKGDSGFRTFHFCGVTRASSSNLDTLAGRRHCFHWQSSV